MKIEKSNINIKMQLDFSKKILKKDIPEDFLNFIKEYSWANIYAKNDVIVGVQGIVSTEVDTKIYRFDGYQIPFYEDTAFGFYILNLHKLKDGKAPVYILSNQEFIMADCYPELKPDPENIGESKLDYNDRINQPDYTVDSEYFYPTKYKSFDEWLAAVDDDDFELII